MAKGDTPGDGVSKAAIIGILIYICLFVTAAVISGIVMF